MKVGNFSSVLPRAKQRAPKPAGHPPHVAIPTGTLPHNQSPHVLEYKDHPTPRKSTTLSYLPWINVIWLISMTIVVAVYMLSGSNAPSPVPVVQKELLNTERQGTEEVSRFTFMPKEGLLSMELPLPMGLALKDILHYDVCCRHRGDFACRLGATRNMGIDCILRTVQAEKGQSSNHATKKRVSAHIVAEHPSMAGAVCWIIYQINNKE